MKSKTHTHRRTDTRQQHMDYFVGGKVIQGVERGQRKEGAISIIRTHTEREKAEVHFSFFGDTRDPGGAKRVGVFKKILLLRRAMFLINNLGFSFPYTMQIKKISKALFFAEQKQVLVIPRLNCPCKGTKITKESLSDYLTLSSH